MDPDVAPDQRAWPVRVGRRLDAEGVRSEEIDVVQAFRPAVSGGPEGPHYIMSDFFTGSSGLPRREPAGLKPC